MENGVEGTDDNALVEAVGYQVTLVDCGNENIKITTPSDVYMAHAILSRRSDEAKEASK